MPKLYKFLNKGLKSQHGKQTWDIGKWYKIDGELQICHNGFHASKQPLDALRYVKGEVLAVVEVRGEHVNESDKQCWSEMRVIDARKWTATDSVELAVFAAEQVIGVYEKAYPNDSRPADAIKAAKEYSKNPAAANAAANADAYAAAYAVNAAYAAANAAANADAYAAAYAVNAAYAAANAAAYAAAYAVNKWMKTKFKTLEKY